MYYKSGQYQNRVSHLIMPLNSVDMELWSSTKCLHLPSLVEIWRERLGMTVKHSDFKLTEPLATRPA